MKILLINPPDNNMIQGAIPRELGSDKMGKYPPLGLLYIARAAQQRIPSLDIRIVDAIADGLTHALVKEEIERFQPDLVGISVYTFTLIDALETASQAKQTRPEATVVFGGFHPTIYPRESLLCSPNVDVAVAGEAEEIFPIICERVLSGGSLENIPGVSFKRRDGTLHVDAAIQVVKNLDQLAFPDRRMVNYGNHMCILGAAGLSTNILSSRGCPFSCKYCYVNIRNYRLRSMENIMSEIRDCMSLGIYEFFFMDDLFNLTKARVIEFCDSIDREGLKIKWSFRGRVDQIDETVLTRARKAGCMRIHYGVESGVPDILRRVNKGTNIEMVKKALSLTRKAGIEVSSNIMIGLPGESPELTEQTIRFLLNIDTDYVQAAVFTPYPETPLYREGVQSGLLPNDYWREFALNPRRDFVPLIWGEYYTREQLFTKLRGLYLRFYMRPRFVFHYLKRIRNLKSVKLMFSNALTFLKLILSRMTK